MTDDEIVGFMQRSPDPAFTTPELANEFGMTTEGVRNRLQNLKAEGDVEMKKPTSRTVIWYLEPGQSLPVSEA